MIAQRLRPGNFRPAPDTFVAVERAMRDAKLTPPKAIGEVRGAAHD